MIVITAKENDAHALRVAPILVSRHGEEVILFDTSLIPSATVLVGRYGDENGAGDLTLVLPGGRRLNLKEVKSFWWRRPQPLMVDPLITDPVASNFAYQESISALFGFLECCEGLWVNNIQNDTAAEYKPFQLKVAAQHGFRIPETLITNSPHELMAFFDNHHGSVVYKAFNQRGLVWRPTRMLRQEDLVQLENLRFAPVIFQDVVPGIRDIRVTAIGERLFAAEFDLERVDEVDYRTRLGEIACRPHTLPTEMEGRIHALMESLALEYGGIDFRLTPDGDYVFFEINTAGEFLFLEDRTGQPISDAMAAHLAGGKAAHPGRKPHSSQPGAEEVGQ
jgi:glutathione synthase/RimK-type ligase-like ATP-grasp enzyme